MTEDVSEPEKGRRLARLFDVIDEQKEAHLSSLVGQKASVLIEGTSKTGHWTGRTFRNEIMHLGKDVSGELAAAELGTGAIVEAKIDESYKNSLAGTILKVELEADAPIAPLGLKVNSKAPVFGDQKRLTVLA
jgi:tRNA A37 methylthiotransferase MiaB